MIEPTDEMREAQDRAIEHAGDDGTADGGERAQRAGLAAVLAIVERDYHVQRRFGPEPGHAFQRHENPRFGSAFGGGCGAQVSTSKGVAVCGWPRQAHREAPPPASAVASRPGHPVMCPCMSCGLDRVHTARVTRERDARRVDP